MEAPILLPSEIDMASHHNEEVQRIAAEDIDSTFKSDTIDLTSSALNSRIVAFSDEWFAEAKNLINPKPPIHRPGVFVHSGAWYDGWETRRHNTKPFDWVIIRLGVASGRVKGVEVDTAFFNGNHAPEISVQGCYIDDLREEEVKKEDFGGWRDILGRQTCGPSQRQAWVVPAEVGKHAWTHVRLCMWPDGGIARFRLYGWAVPILPSNPEAVFDLAATVNGGVAVACSDQHFGTKDNLLLPGRGVDMGDGWETKRTRGEHVDWVIVRLGVPGRIDKLIVDTAHFRGNFPQKVRIFGAPAGKEAPGYDDQAWKKILDDQPCGPDKEHEFGKEVLTSVAGEDDVFGWVMMVIVPDGGVKRLRVLGRRAATGNLVGRAGKV